MAVCLRIIKETQKMTKKSETSTAQSNEPDNLLETMHNRLRQALSASGLTEKATELPIAAGKSEVTFKPQKQSKQTKQQTD